MHDCGFFPPYYRNQCGTGRRKEENNVKLGIEKGAWVLTNPRILCIFACLNSTFVNETT